MSPMQHDGDNNNEDSRGTKRRISNEKERNDDSTDDRASGGEAALEDDTRLEAKRAYNRVNAARARQRVKDQLADLSQRVESFADKNHKLERTNEELIKRVASLTEENQMLRRIVLSTHDGTMGGGGVAGVGAMDDRGLLAAGAYGAAGGGAGGGFPFHPALQQQALMQAYGFRGAPAVGPNAGVGMAHFQPNAAGAAPGVGGPGASIREFLLARSAGAEGAEGNSNTSDAVFASQFLAAQRGVSAPEVSIESQEALLASYLGRKDAPHGGTRSDRR